LIAAFIPQQSYLGGLLNLQGLTLAALYALGIVAAIAVALVLKRTLLRGAAPPLLLELPSYKRPSARVVLYRVTQRCRVFVRTAGTLILAVSILVWAAMYYPHDGTPHERQSVLCRVGRLIEPAVKPLGWDWRIGCAVVASLPAREIVVATLGVVYNAGDCPDFQATTRGVGPKMGLSPSRDIEIDAAAAPGSMNLPEKLRSATWEGSDEPVFNIPVALSIMVFFALCAQCAATLAVIRRETNSWRWPAFTFAYMTALAYLGALMTYRLGMWLSG